MYEGTEAGMSFNHCQNIGRFVQQEATHVQSGWTYGSAAMNKSQAMKGSRL